MEITCFNCGQTWRVAAGQLLAAKLRFGLGFTNHTFSCPNCDAKNVIIDTDVRSSEQANHLIPLTGAHPEVDTHPPRATNSGASAPTNPVPGPRITSKQIHAVVLERGLPLRREHERNAEIMDTLRKDENVIILDTWTNGEDTWVQLGPERWAVIEQDGEALIRLLDA